MDILGLVLPVFAVIVTGWVAAAAGYVPKTLAEPLVRFAYHVAMPALVFLTIAQQPLHALLDWRFLAAFGGGSILSFLAVLVGASVWRRRGTGSSAVIGAAASMTNTGFVALPILHALYGQQGVLPAAIATMFIAVVLLPILIVLLEMDRPGSGERRQLPALAKEIMLNPPMISTLLGLLWSAARLPLPGPVATYVGIMGDALTPCALFAIGLGLSLGALREGLRLSLLLSALKLLATPALVYGLCLALGLDAFLTRAAVVCAAVPTAKTAYVLASEFKVEAAAVASTVSITTLISVVTLLGWLYALS